jgi:hypothetical protein
MATLELFNTLLEFLNVQAFSAIEIIDLEGLADCLLLVVYFFQSALTLRKSIVLFSHQVTL